MRSRIQLAIAALLALGAAACAWEHYIFDLPSGVGEAAWRDALAERLGGKAEAPVEGGRVDVLTDTQAIEVDWPHKWHEGLGQALHYADQTGKTGVVALISYGQGPENIQERTRQRFEMVERLCRQNGIALVILFPSAERVDKGLRDGTRSPSETKGLFWLNSGSGVRHRRGCPYYENTEQGYHCGPEEGKPCGVCGG